MTVKTDAITLEDALREAIRDKRPEEADRLRLAITENRAIVAAIDRMDYSTAEALSNAKRERLANDRDG